MTRTIRSTHPPNDNPASNQAAMTDATQYTHPKVWSSTKKQQRVGINRPIAEATYEKELPVGDGPTATTRSDPKQ